MLGTVAFLHVDEGALVEPGDQVIAIEAMKQQHDITAEYGGTVHFLVALGEMVEQDQVLVEITEA